MSLRPGDLIEELRGQQGNVLAALSQRRYAQLEHRDPVVEVLTEEALANQLHQVAVGGRQQSEVRGDLLGATDAREGSLLDYAQQLCLQQRTELRYLVQKESAAVRTLEEPLAQVVGAGEGAAFVAKELGFLQGLRDGGAVDRDQGRIRTATLGVDGVRNQLFARSALAMDQHRDIGGRHELDLTVEVEHGRRGPDDAEGAPIAVFVLKLGQPHRHAMSLRGVAGDELQAGRVERLGQVVEGPGVHGGHDAVHVAVGRNHDHR